MANPEHLEILKQGHPVWNDWRRENRTIIPDLSSADLTQVHLRTVHLEGANLIRVDLTNVDLWGGYLSGADLSGAKLDSTNLKVAHLNDAKLVKTALLNVDLTFADLNNADLSRATIGFVEFRAAKLSGADFTESYSGYNNYREIDLSQVKGLETIIHSGPSSIGIDTIYQSQGKIHEAFLRGCGVPEDFITYIRSLTVQPIQFYSCFISYSSKDQDFAERLHADLQNKGVRCWFAPEDLKIGDRIRPRIDESIRVHDKLLLVLSETSVAS